MDFLDPKKQRRHARLLYAGYLFIGIAVLISTLVLVYQANGYGVNGKGELVQKGLIFVSSQPNPADIYVDGVKDKLQTNTRLSLATGAYSMRLSRAGYYDWTHTVSVLGGDVQNFDYPFLFPKNLQTAAVANFDAAPGVMSQSRDRRWLVVQQSTTATAFSLFDLTKKDIAGENVSLPSGIVTAANGPEAWEEVAWATDNEHLLLKHTYGSAYEFILLDRVTPADSVNLNTTLGITPTQLTLIDNKYDQYHVLVDGTLSSTQLGNPTLQTMLKNVLAYKSYGTKTVLYVTNSAATQGKVNVAMLVEDKDYTLRQIAASSTYPLDVATYRGDQYVVLGGSSENMVYVYKNPVEQLRDSAITTADAARALRVAGATHVSFSPTAQFIVAENGSNFAVYDSYLKRAYTYDTKRALDAPQTHAEWMDGAHLTYASGGEQVVIDYDQRNPRQLMTVLPAQGAHFSQDYRYVFAAGKDASGKFTLTRTALRTAADL